ncbi:hypothetical protein SAMN04487764_0922 [Gillisia sp. Hel1_33_143]|uniref:transcription elongation factor n=1 Tax=Gillisia sp. Hel1_33_143 TaxID=1336796 RepID=UPI00087BC899|nr:transcription elongation factor [Gillisia sp. Hel1_33_143]SDR88050.1 hypothetical protein SAMN04487764_0922 [Gillisia sp. Hel1_33_143]
MKEQLFTACKDYLEERINRIQSSLEDLNEALQNETKSSAGDKYETSREMINTEVNKLSVQLQQFKKLQATLEMARIRKDSTTVQLGSAVKTSAANYFLAIPAGEINSGKEKFYAIGVNSPVAQALMGKAVSENFSFNGKENKILDIF